MSVICLTLHYQIKPTDPLTSTLSAFLANEIFACRYFLVRKKLASTQTQVAYLCQSCGFRQILLPVISDSS